MKIFRLLPLLSFVVSLPLYALDLKIGHVNDSHSHFRGANLKGEETGSVALLAGAVKELRAKEKNFLFLNAGDSFQGSLYFHAGQGADNVVVWNAIAPDAFVPGNHEFDLGAKYFDDVFASQAHFPIIAANVQGKYAKAFVPYVVKDFGGEKVAIIGLTTRDTTRISSPGDGVVFSNAQKAAAETIALLKKKNIKNIILLTHVGLKEDIELARSLHEVDIIVGGHSHTRMGNPKLMGAGTTAYPQFEKNADGERVAIVQSWEHLKVMGLLNVRLENGVLKSASGNNVLLVSKKRTGRKWKNFDQFVVKEDPELVAFVKSKDVALQKWREKKVAHLERDYALMNGAAGNLVVRAMKKKSGTDIVLQNLGGVRSGLKEGDITPADIYEVLPFGNTLVTLELSGSELLAMLQAAKNFSLLRGYPAAISPWYGEGLRRKKLAQAKLLDATYEISDFQVFDRASGKWVDLEEKKKYSIALNSFMANGGDGYKFPEAAQMTDTGFVDRDVLLEYLSSGGK